MLSSGLKSFIGAPTFVRKNFQPFLSAGSVVGSKAHRIQGPQVKLFDAGIMIALCEYTQFYYKAVASRSEDWLLHLGYKS